MTASRQRTMRLLLSVGLGLIVAIGFWLRPISPAAGDLTPVLRGSRDLLAGRSPYPVSVAPDGSGSRMLYPMPAYLVTLPLAWLSDPMARVVWAALAMGALTWVMVGRFGVHGLSVVISRSAERALMLAQWSPWFLLGAVAPGWQVFSVAKPTLALIVWCYRPSRWAFVGGACLLAAAFAIRPSWVHEWLAQSAGVTWYVPAAFVWQGGGPLVLLAGLRWRRPEARLLLAMAAVPHNFIWYDQLLLFLVPVTTVEVWTLSALSWISAVVGTMLFWRGGIPEPMGQSAFRAPIVALMYLPALVMVLRRPNVGRDE